MSSHSILFRFADRSSADAAFDTLHELDYEPVRRKDAAGCTLQIQIDRRDLTSALEIAQAHGGSLVDSRLAAEQTREFHKIGSERESELDPFEIEFLPEFEQGRGPRRAFINKYGVVIGDHLYESPESPLQQWDEEVEPSIMSGDQWVHPFKDIGFRTDENRDYFEQGIPPRKGQFMHPTQDAAYRSSGKEDDEAPEREK